MPCKAIGNLPSTKLRAEIDTRLARDDESLFMVLLTAVHTDGQAKSVSLLPSLFLFFVFSSRDTSNVVPARF